MIQTEFRAELVPPTVFIAPGAVVVGDITLAEEVSVWFNATLRGDTTPIRIGPGTNIQEGCLTYCTITSSPGSKRTQLPLGP
jgi:carbonic anhydrase/acetyltransferase-like protein (isoleucine patch superfamily)